jgi:hypothetical protein
MLLCIDADVYTYPGCPQFHLLLQKKNETISLPCFLLLLCSAVVFVSYQLLWLVARLLRFKSQYARRPSIL